MKSAEADQCHVPAKDKPKGREDIARRKEQAAVTRNVPVTWSKKRNGAFNQIRTDDPHLTMVVLYRLSYEGLLNHTITSLFSCQSSQAVFYFPGSNF